MEQMIAQAERFGTQCVIYDNAESTIDLGAFEATVYPPRRRVKKSSPMC